jgi:hypothetical protein
VNPASSYRENHTANKHLTRRSSSLQDVTSASSQSSLAIWLPLLTTTSTHSSGEGSPKEGKTEASERGDSAATDVAREDVFRSPFSGRKPRRREDAARKQRQPQGGIENWLTHH